MSRLDRGRLARGTLSLSVGSEFVTRRGAALPDRINRAAGFPPGLWCGSENFPSGFTRSMTSFRITE
ncbi:hypothetical protein TOK_0844 [Pseudonocardia sp. N23]|nr:hypothetical protein TOK_0844 [Pseudonocardia sp. N23]